MGPIAICITIFLFAFSTVIAGYYYGEACLKYLKRKTNKFDIFLLKIATLISILLGSTISSKLLWNAIDVCVALLAIINIYSIFKLRNIVISKVNKNK